MSTVTVNLYEQERCRIIHQHSGTAITTDGPIEWGGKGRTFSPTDLMSAALGSCILSVLEPVFERNGNDPQQVEFTVVKELARNPLRIASFSITIVYPESMTDSFRKKVLKAIETCPVKRSLSPDVDITIELLADHT